MRNAMPEISRVDLRYLDRLHPRLSRVLARMDDEGGKEDIPVVGTAVGRFLRVLATAIKAKRVLEIGTAIGYSALWLGGALPRGGELVTIDPDVTRTDRAKANWREARIAARLVVKNGAALEVLPTLKGRFDLVFIDALKREYSGYLDRSLPLLRPGGVVAVDNLLWSGRASGATAADDPDTLAIRAFNERFLAHRSLVATIIPLGDGLGVGVKR
jgi:predicted O-methyltransferase YrrM